MTGVQRIVIGIVKYRRVYYTSSTKEQGANFLSEFDLESHAGIEPSLSILEEIKLDLDNLRAASEADGVEILSPVLALGISERVGSNWFLDSLTHSMQTHNEPFRQQLHGTHPLSTISPRPATATHYPVSEMHPYERYWLSSFVISKHTPERQLIKETNLFFANRNFVSFFPDSKVVVLARNPIGIASSFTDSDLFRRWNYAERYNQLKAMTRQSQYEQYEFVFDGDHDPGSLRKLTRLIFLNTLLISEAVADMEIHVVRYEDTVANRVESLGRAALFITDGHSEMFEIEPEKRGVGTSEHVFSTRKVKDELLANLDEDDVEVIRNETRRLMADSLSLLSEERYTQVQDILELHTDEYATRGRKLSQGINKHKPENNNFEVPEFQFISDPNQEIRWGNRLVTNSEFVQFMNEMHGEGIPNVINGTQLFVNENMIPARGGRIWFNPNKGDYEVTPSYEEYPIYWITWLGAAAFARYRGARLPYLAEVQRFVEHSGKIDFETLNCDHRFDDVTPTGFTPPDEVGIYDMVGNLAIWCQDGFTKSSGQGTSRFMYGVAWNRDGSRAELEKIKSRPLSGSSRSVGVRLVESNKPSLSSQELAKRFEGWFTLLNGNVDRSRADRYIIDQLTI